MGGFNGSGTYVRFYDWTDDAGNNIKIRADRMDTEHDGFATGLSSCITKDGQTTVTANLPMATYRHTGVGNAAARTDYSAFGQVQDGKTNWVDGGGTADAITAANTIPLTALVDGQLCHVRATAANATTTPTFAPDGLTARTIVKFGGTALIAGDIVGDGHELILRYDLTNTRWELLNPKDSNLTLNNTFSGNNSFTGTTTLTGAVAVSGTASAQASISLAEDTDNGTNKVTIQPPASLAADYTLTLPVDDGTSGQGLSTDGSGVLSWADFALVSYVDSQVAAVVASGTKINTTSGTTAAFTGIPAGVTNIRIGLSGVSTNGTSDIELVLGDSGGYETSGYTGATSRFGASSVGTVSMPTDAFIVADDVAAADTHDGIIDLMLVDAATNTWVMKVTLGQANTNNAQCGAGSKALSATLDRLQLQTENGTDTFDAGMANITYW